MIEKRLSAGALCVYKKTGGFEESPDLEERRSENFHKLTKSNFK